MFVDSTRAISGYNPVNLEQKWTASAVLEKICHVASKIFHAIKIALSIPLRYLGSKTWSLPGLICRFPVVAIKHLFGSKGNFKEDLFGSGFHRFDRKLLSSEEIKPLIQYASAAAAIHSKHFDSWTDPLGFRVVSPKELIKDLSEKLPSSVLVKDDCFFDPETGLKAAILKRDNQYVLVFGALMSSNTEVDEGVSKKLNNSMWNNSAANLAGFIPSIYLKANALVEMIKEIPEIKSGHLELCGQCLGGSIASFAGIKNEVKTICLNTFPLGVGLQYELGDEKLKHSDKYVSHIICETDFMSDLPKLFGALDALVNFIGLKTAGNFGKKFTFPNPFPSYSGKTHLNIASAMFLHAGFGERDKPGDIFHDSNARTVFQAAQS